MKKAILSLTLFGLLILNVQAKDINLSLCEYSQEYINWLNLSEKERANTDMPYMCKITEENNKTGFVPTPNMSIYSLRDKYTLSVQDQGDTKDCWAMATLEAIESNMLLRKVASEHLSAAHLELKTQNSLYMPGYTNFNRKFNSGGSIELTNAYILNNWGPILEKDLKFSTITDILQNQSNFKVSFVEDRKPILDVDNIYMLRNNMGACSNDSIARIKEYLTTKGAMAANMYFEMATNNYQAINENGLYEIKDKFLNGKFYYYNGDDYTDSYNNYFSKNQVLNHQVLIVGWDDTISKDSFTTKPSQDGAWIVMNSYGETKELLKGKTFNIGDKGYYYVSYDDINICTNLVGYYDVTNKVSDYAYFYDDLGVNSSINNNENTVYLANIFSKKSKGTEVLDKVTIAVDGPNYKYTIYYADNDSLTNYKKIGEGISEHEGYVSVRLEEKIYVADKFSVIVKLEKPDSNSLTIPIAINATNSTLYQNYKVTEGVSYISNDGNVWAPFESSSYVIQNSIRAYTSESDEIVDSKSGDDGQINDGANVNITNPNRESSNTSSRDKNILPDNPKTGIKDVAIIILLLGTGLFIIKKMIINKFYKL